jgi:acetyl esterase
MKKTLTVILLSIACIIQSKSQTKDVIYKQIDTIQLHLAIQYPTNLDVTKDYPTIIFFHGGGWVNGTKNQFASQAKHYSQLGFVTVLADYRLKNSHKTTPFESLKDAKTAIRYLRKNAKNLQIDASNVIAAGGSAGGHLAAACFTNEDINESTDDLKISCKPNVLILFNPVIDNSKEGYGFERIGEKYIDFSPLHNIKKGFPAAIFMLGTNDNLIPVTTAQNFKAKIEAVGGRCDLKLYEGENHGFFNKSPFLEQTIADTDKFLKSLGYL